MAALTTRPQDRAERINADVAQRAAAIVAQHGPAFGLTEYEQKLDRERAVAITEASLLRGYVHSLCREIANLEQYLGAGAGRDAIGIGSCVVQHHGRPVLLSYRVETDEAPDGTRRPDVILERVNGMDADVLDVEQIERWQAECERDYRGEVEQMRTDAAVDDYLSRRAA